MAKSPALALRGLKNPRLSASVSASRPARTKTPEFTFEREDCAGSTGTRVEILLGEGRRSSALAWARSAAQLAGRGEIYRGRPSHHWYDGEAFFDLLQAAGDRRVRELVAELDGCTGAKAGRIAQACKGRTCSSLTRAEAIELLEAAQQEARRATARRLGHVGEVEGWPLFYARGEGTFSCGGIGGLSASTPVVAEAWAPADRLRRHLLDVRQPHADHGHGQSLGQLLAAQGGPQERGT